MVKKTKKILSGSAIVLALSMAMSSVGFATDSNKVGGEKLAIANVSDTLLIRTDASADSEVVGYVKGGAGVLVEKLNADWSKITSGKVSGYVKTSCLAFDEKAEELKNVYGVYGAVAAWDDVKVFSDYENTSSIIGTLKAGEGYEILGSSDNWIEIQLKNGNTAYVAAEDVKATMVVDTAVAVGDSDNTYYEEAAQSDAPESSYTEEVVYSEPAYTDESYAEDNGVGDVSCTEEPSYTEDTAYTEETVYTDPTEYEESAVEETVQDDTETQESEYTEYTESYDEESYGVADDEEEDSYVENEADIEDEADIEEVEPEGEAVQETVNSSAATTAVDTASDGDLDLLAAIIYCEAGNQSEEGKIAVGQVVMNRVASSSFPDSISDVIYQSGQFTPAGSGQLGSVIGQAPADCYDAALAALNGEGSVPDALYFNAGSGKGTQIGAHQFY